MIGLLRGQLAEKHPNQVLLDVGGVGYVVFIPLSTFYALGDLRSETTLIFTPTFREDALSLYGFPRCARKTPLRTFNLRLRRGAFAGAEDSFRHETDDLVPAIRAGDLPKPHFNSGVGRKNRRAHRAGVARQTLRRGSSRKPEIADSMGRTQLEADVISALDQLSATMAHRRKTPWPPRFRGADNANFEAVLRATLQQLSAPAPKGDASAGMSLPRNASFPALPATKTRAWTPASAPRAGRIHRSVTREGKYPDRHRGRAQPRRSARSRAALWPAGPWQNFAGADHRQRNGRGHQNQRRPHAGAQGRPHRRC